MKDKRALIVGGIVAFIALTYWLFQDSSGTIPGEEVEELGREHIQDISEIQYNSNPPTSGNHFAYWAKKGVYDRVISDGYLIHSLEHGYVNISYNCGEPNSPLTPIVSPTISTDQATLSAEISAKPLTKLVPPTGGLVQWYTPDNPPAPEVSLPESFRSIECKSLVDQLSKLTKVADRVIVVPRPNMETRVALTAWGRILKLNGTGADQTLNEDEYKEAELFARKLQNKGPEKTME
jgi:hypothetical protein